MHIYVYMYVHIYIYIYIYVHIFVLFVCQGRAAHSESLSAPGGGLAALLLSGCLFARHGQETKFLFILCGQSQVVSEAGAWSFARPEPFLIFVYLSLFVVLLALLLRL